MIGVIENVVTTEKLIRLCLSQTDPTVRELPLKWLSDLLLKIQNDAEAVTFNRRSAGLPFLIRAFLRAAKGSIHSWSLNSSASLGVFGVNPDSPAFLFSMRPF